jgi:SAM-dependent methyltransferase
MIDVREYFKRYPAFYFFVATIFGPLLYSGMSTQKFLRLFPSTGQVLNLGSGPRIIAPAVTNVDMVAYPGVAIVADVSAVPLPDGSVSRIISNTVLEHVRDPNVAVREMHRLLESGGVAYVTIPFLYPFHSSPNDYHRWTLEGAKELFREFEIIEIGIRAGPFSALCAWAVHMVGFIFSFGSPTFNSLFTNLSMFILFPLKLPDVIFNHWPQSHMVASVFYCVIRKR